MDNIFDGIQRPLKEIAEKSNSMYIPRGIEVNPIDIVKQYEFKPLKKVGDIVRPGDIIGVAFENRCIKEHKILLPPWCRGGRINHMTPYGNYNVVEEL